MYDIEPAEDFQLHGSAQSRNLSSCLVDEIYIRWTTFVPPIHESANEKESAYTRTQEYLRKDIEGSFGVLKGRFYILRKESYLRRKKDVLAVSVHFVILHNILALINQEGAFQEDANEDR